MNQEYKGFKCVSSFDFKGTPLHLYKSEKTGLQIGVAEVEGPLVNSFLAVSTEADSHDGCPHVLEHLIFLGSEDYPYKGMLDQLANRCFARGTNAWTDVDHTCYTLTTAGSEGTLNLLPVYMDHILYPTITESGFYTEVHHIDDSGENSGVVYGEMQDCENTGDTLVYHTLMETLFEGTGYSQNTGGRMENLRKLQVDTVRKYHQDYYRPDNVCAILTGQIKIEQVIDSLLPIEEKILKKNLKYKQERPWSKPISKLEKSIEKEILFASDDDSGGGIISFGWKEPNIKYSDFLEKESIQYFWKYLSHSAVSPLQKEMVELEDPYCGDISCWSTCFRESGYMISFSNIETVKMKLIKNKFYEVLQDVLKKGIDMKRMKSILNRERVKFLSNFEEDPHNTYAMHFINNFLYCNKSSELQESMEEDVRISKLLEQNENFWLNILKKYIIDLPCVCIVGTPSSEYGEKLSENEKQRIEKQAEDLGDDGLDELSKKLEAAKEKNEQPIPNEILESFKVPDVKSISFIPVSTYRSNEKPIDEKTVKLQQILGDEKQDIPYFVQFDHINTSFVEFKVFMDTSDLSEQLRLYLELYLECLFECPIEKKEVKLTHEEVVQLLNDETVSFSNGTGLSGGNFVCGSFAQLTYFEMKFDSSKFERGLEWIHDILWNTKFDPERIKISAVKLINDVSNFKRDAKSISRAAINRLNFNVTKSNHNVCDFNKQHDFLTKLVEKLEKDSESVIKEMNDFRSFITDPSRIRLNIITNFNEKKNVKSTLFDKFLKSEKIHQPNSFTFTKELLTNEYQNTTTSKDGAIFGISSTDSSNLFQTTTGIDSYSHDDIAALMVVIEYLTGLEGPFWKKIRGLGLSYSYSIYSSIEQGLTYFMLRKSTSLVKAYFEAKKIIEEYVDGREQFDQTMLDSAKSAVIFAIISREETLYDAANQQFYNYLKNLPRDGNKKLLEKIAKVNMDDIKFALKKYLVDIFDEKKSIAVVTTNTQKVKEITEEFKETRNFKENEKIFE
eukprot:gene6879-11041_t